MIVCKRNRSELKERKFTHVTKIRQEVYVSCSGTSAGFRSVFASRILLRWPYHLAHFLLLFTI